MVIHPIQGPPGRESVPEKTCEFNFEYTEEITKAMSKMWSAQDAARSAAMDVAFRLKTQGHSYRTDSALAEATAALALTVAMASAGHAVRSPKKPCEKTDSSTAEAYYCMSFTSLKNGATENMMAAHALSAAMCACARIAATDAASSTSRSTSTLWSRASYGWGWLDRLFGWHIVSRPKPYLPRPLDGVVRLIIASTEESVAAVAYVIDAAKKTDNITTRLSTGWHMHYDAHDISRLYTASRLASASASAATAAASAMRTFDPAMSVKASQAACDALAASNSASTLRMEIIMETRGHLLKGSGLWRPFVKGGGMQDWLTKLERFGSDNFYAECKNFEESNSRRKVHDARSEGHHYSSAIDYKLENGTVIVTTTSGQCKECEESSDDGKMSLDADVSESSSITLDASTPD